MRRIYSHKDHNISTCTLSECLLNCESLCQQNCTTTMCFSEGALKTRRCVIQSGFWDHPSSPQQHLWQRHPQQRRFYICQVWRCFPSNGPNHQACHHYNKDSLPRHTSLPLWFVPPKNVHTLPVGNYIPASCLTAADRARKNKSGLCFPFFSPCLEIRQ